MVPKLRVCPIGALWDIRISNCEHAANVECVDRLNSGGNHEDGGVGGPGVNVDDLSNDTNGVGGNEENPTGTDGEGAEETDNMDTGINGERADGSTNIEISITNDITVINDSNNNLEPNETIRSGACKIVADTLLKLTCIVLINQCLINL